MFRNFFLTLCVLSSLFCLQLFSNPSEGKASVSWITNYDQAVQESKASSKPLVLFFTGSDWCGWCTKIEDEALGTPEFAASAGNKFIFAKLDFPLYSNQDPNVKKQNKELQERFNVRSFPTIIVIDVKQNRQIGITGYRPGGGKSFADHLLKMLSDYSAMN